MKVNHPKTKQKTLLITLILLMITSCGDENRRLLVATPLIETGDHVISPPSGFDPFYKKYINANGIPITGSDNVQDEAFIRARHTVINMLAKRPDVLAQMILHNARVGIVAGEEETSDLPEYKYVEDKVYFSERGRGYGGTVIQPFASCSEENLMREDRDVKTGAIDEFRSFDLLVHEFAHSIHLIGMINTVPGFQETLQKTFDSAIAKGLWVNTNTYASTNPEEYFAEGAVCWFYAENKERVEEGLLYNYNRAELKEYDPDLYALLKTIFHENDWRPIPF